jgi:tetratricopeptide (TPR) repeat protein
MARNAVIKVLRSNLKRALRSGHLSETEGLLEQLKDEDPLSVETRGLELETLIAARRWSDATKLASQLSELFPASARIRYLTARVHYHNKNYPRALEQFAESERIHPHWSSRRWLGKTHTQLGHYQEAEASLIDLCAEHPQVRLDLAWLYERRDDPQRALRYLEEYLSFRPDDEFAKAQRLRLRANVLAADELVAEVDTLRDLEETVPPELLPTYVKRLLETGQGAAARQFIEHQHVQWDERISASVAWECHHLQAYDLALRLFLRGLSVYYRDFKYLSALEFAAIRCQRVDEVVTAYETHAADNNRLYGRTKALKKRAGIHPDSD